MTWGVGSSIPYDADDPEHYKRRHNVTIDIAGVKRIEPVFQLYLLEVIPFVHW